MMNDLKEPAALGGWGNTVEKALAEVEAEHIVLRIWEHDHTVWKSDPGEIANRLGWLHSAENMRDALPGLRLFTDSVREAGYDRVLLLGMGGSSLAPELFSKTFGARPGYPSLQVLDSTDPGAVLAAAEGLDLARTLFIVSTKSGGTVETLSFFKFFYSRTQAELGAEEAGRHFVAITDPGSRLAALAREHNFRKTFLNDPNIGGRFSALSCFGLVPAALLGINLDLLLDRALGAAGRASRNSLLKGDKEGARLGVIIAELARAGCDKLTFLLSAQLAGFGDWVEQLIAESTGKEGRGILPVVGEAVGEGRVYGADRLFVVMHLEGDDSLDRPAAELKAAGFPLLRLTLTDIYDLGAQFFIWEMATVVAGHRLGINPFDQPNVESAKILAREMVEAFNRSGSLPEDRPEEASPGVLEEFLRQAREGDYICLQAYLQPRQETFTALQALRGALRDRYRLATTLGYGPRFLHSTGQLHKGDGGGGLFIQLTAPDRRDAMIPARAGGADSPLSFATLKLAQVLGDKQALLEARRRVICLELEGDIPAALAKLTSSL